MRALTGPRCTPKPARPRPAIRCCAPPVMRPSRSDHSRYLTPGRSMPAETKETFLCASNCGSAGVPVWRRANRAQSKRLGARCLAPSRNYSPARGDGCAKVRRYCRKARGSGRCMKKGLILSLLRATAERTVVRGLAPSPVSSPLLAISCPSLAAAGWSGLLWVCGRALECGCFPAGCRGDQGPARCCCTMRATAWIGYPSCCRCDSSRRAAAEASVGPRKGARN